MITQLFGINEKCSYTCKCGHSWEENKMKYPITIMNNDDEGKLVYEILKLLSNTKIFADTLPFYELLRRSLNFEQSMSAYCDKCVKFQYVVCR